MEPRQLLAAAPLFVGATYLEGDTGTDHQGDTFEITFEGGAPGTELTRLVINGDQNQSGLGYGDMIFDTLPSGLGAGAAFPLTVVSLTTRDPLAAPPEVQASVADGSSQLVLDFQGFHVGDRLVLSIDVDEVQRFKPTWELSQINQNVDPIASGVEFAQSQLTASFSAPHYHDANATSEFLDAYDAALAGTGLTLPLDAAAGFPDRTAGAVGTVLQQPLPVAISGTVYLEHNLDLVRDAGEPGLSGVQLELWKREDQGANYRATGYTATSGADGTYAFGLDLDLSPGVYQVREVQPDSVFSVGAIRGTVDGQAVGATVAGNPDLLTDIEIPLGDQRGENYDFAEARPAEISGYVYHDRNNDGRRDAGEEGLANVPLQIVPVSAIGTQNSLSVVTDASGFYQASGLPPGTYRILETSEPPGYLDGLVAAGTVDGVPSGTAVHPGDRIESIFLGGGQSGVEYDFGELVPASLAGHVRLSDADGKCHVAAVDYPPVAGVTVRLLDSAGQVLATTTTDALGVYRFGGLAPGTYTVAETTPPDLLDADEHVGQVDGQPDGRITANDTLGEIVLASAQTGQDYDFCESVPASLAGVVYHDRNNNGRRESGEEGLAGIQVALANAAGVQVATTTTDQLGHYQFSRQPAGVYAIGETQPTGWVDGSDTAGTIGGVTVGQATNPGDRIGNIRLRYGDQGADYDFGELHYAVIQGSVHLTGPEGDCYAPGGDQPPVAEVAIVLQNDRGETIAQATTDSQGGYRFDTLLPGSYTVIETTPENLIDGEDHLGTVDGVTVGELAGNDVIRGIAVTSAQVGVEYDFCELLSGSIAGYVHTDLNGDCVFDANESPLPSVTIELRSGAGQLLATTQTDSQGRYEFEDLPPGTYTLREQPPSGYFHGGQKAGSGGGDDSLDDIISDIAVGSGRHLTDYMFCEVPPATLAGAVFADLNGNGQQDAGELPIGGVTLELLDGNGQLLATTQTDSQGQYHFDHLRPGTYAVRERQPVGYLQGSQRAGSGGGNSAVQDLISAISIQPAAELTDYDFCEIPPSSLAGSVFVDRNQNLVLDPGETSLPGVTVRLLDAAGRTLATVRTDFAGRYRFDELTPGSYAVQEAQPAGYFHGGQRAGSGGGTDSIDNLISSIAVPADEALVDYDFCEYPPGRLSGYVFQDGDSISTPDGTPPAQLRPQHNGVWKSGDQPLAGVTIELRNGDNGAPLRGEQLLPGVYPPGPVRTATDANGYYEFLGLPPGHYAVYETQPAKYTDGLDTPGTTGGLALNAEDQVDPSVTRGWHDLPLHDAIIGIPLGVAAVSEQNNFSEVVVTAELPPVPRESPRPAPSPVSPFYLPAPAPVAPPVIFVPAPPVHTEVSYGPHGTLDFTWHLSVVDAGKPRGERANAPLEGLVWRTAMSADARQWHARRLREGHWLLRTGISADDGSGEIRECDFGLQGGGPIVGDWNGDGVDEIGVFYQGQWFLDLNGNGRWDDDDLWAQLGTEYDLPVTGDWDGDGKDDIGIFGPAWLGDPQALRVESGVPDLRNRTTPLWKPKNMPPQPEDATSGVRLLKRTAKGALQADVIDHVFRYGVGVQVPVVGDWNGDGIKNIGVFLDGRWYLDMDGDGRWSEGDLMVEFGQPGDIPVVGDFSGQGLDQIGIYRNGTWIIDINHNYRTDPHDKLFELGGPGDIPVVGDWDGDGVDDPGVYRDSPAEPARQAKQASPAPAEVIQE